jgi:hypothetical protein
VTPPGFYRVRVDVLVPEGLPRWAALRFGVSEAKAKRLVDRAVRLHAQLWTSIAEVLEPGAGETEEERTLVFSSVFRSSPREGDRWFECLSNKPRAMVQGKAIYEETVR